MDKEQNKDQNTTGATEQEAQTQAQQSSEDINKVLLEIKEKLDRSSSDAEKLKAELEAKEKELKQARYKIQQLKKSQKEVDGFDVIDDADDETPIIDPERIAELAAAKLQEAFGAKEKDAKLNEMLNTVENEYEREAIKKALEFTKVDDDPKIAFEMARTFVQNQIQQATTPSKEEQPASDTANPSQSGTVLPQASEVMGSQGYLNSKEQEPEYISELKKKFGVQTD